MKAVVLTGIGDVDKLELQDVPEPNPGPGEVKIRIAAACINPVDWKMRRGEREVSPPQILGRDAAGEVVELGPGVTSLKVGDQVLGVVFHGYAEFVAARADTLAKVPSNMRVEDAAALPTVVTTGVQLVEDATRPNRGDTILVTGALGGVGRTAVYVAKKRGARVLAGVHTRQKEQARELGADGVFAIDDDVEIAKLPPLDEIADTVAGATITKPIPHLKQGGRVGSVLPEPEAAKKQGIEVRSFVAHPDGKQLGEMVVAVARGELRIPIAERRPLSDIREATRLAERGLSGKVLLTT